MNNKVETLRAICYTADDMENIKNLGDIFSKKDIEFMVEFKKIYELGLDQLKKFIDKLDSEGKDLDTYSILYYVETLLNGPLGSFAREFSKDKKYFISMPDSMGGLGNVTKSPSNVTIYVDMEYPLGTSVDVFNKLPAISQQTLINSIKITEDVFRSSMYSSSLIDNTLPIVDKRNSDKYNGDEKEAIWELKSNGTYLNKDRYFYLSTANVSQQIFDKVKAMLGEENFRVYFDKKQYSPFDIEKNQSVSLNSKVEKEFFSEPDKDGNRNKVLVTLDLLGDEFDSDKKRETVLKIQAPEKEKEYLINSNTGQLGG